MVGCMNCLGLNLGQALSECLALNQSSFFLLGLDYSLAQDFNNMLLNVYLMYYNCMAGVVPSN